MAATMSITSDPIGLTKGFIRWHQSESRLRLSGDNGCIETHAVDVVGFATAQHALKRAHHYSICGPFSHDPATDTTLIRYPNDTQTEVRIRDTLECKETRATVSGLGKVSHIVFAEGKNTAQPWNMILTADHDFYDSLGHKFIKFSVDYHFGYHTPSPVDWNRFTSVEKMWLYGIVVAKTTAKTTIPARYVVEVFDFSIVTPNNEL